MGWCLFWQLTAIVARPVVCPVKDEKEYGSDKAIIKYFFCKQCQGRVLADSALRMSSSVELSDTPQHNPRTNECGPAGLARKMR